MMGITSLRLLLLAAFVLSNVSWTKSKHHFRHNVNGHRSRHRRQDAGLFHPASYVIPGGEGTGAWGEWGKVSPCSRTCGGGVANQKRICLQVGPDGEPLCSGGDTKYFSCQTQNCPENAGDFRAEQCSEYDKQSFRGSEITYSWVPYTKGPKPCELNCMPRGERFYYKWKSQVVDGTRCNDDSFNVCVEGACQPVGCDLMLGSNAREDKCRNCRGNGTNCYTAAGLLDTNDLRKGYNDMLLIPQGATNVFIEEVRASNNYLALRAKQNNVYYLNGNYSIDFPRSLTIAGTLWHYERSQQGLAAPDKLRCLGPTIEPLYLSLLLQDHNVGINYEYSVPSALAPPLNQQYNWVHESFSECSATCGGGFQVREVTCRSREELDIVDEILCDEGLRPPTNQTCNIEDCPPRWVEGPWSPCSRPCGEGGTRSRQVYCEKIITNRETFRFPSIVADKECFDLLGPKPELYQTCNQNATCPTWFTGPWKPCNRLCGEGKQTRQVVCHQRINGFVQLFEDRECEDEKPITEKACLLHPCDGVDWVISDWSGCDTCLSTVRTRVAHCATKDHKVIDSDLCSYHPTPILNEPCDRTKLPSCQVQWYATQWSNCSVECGKGVRTRRVFCGLFDGASVIKVGDDRCEKEYKYNDTTECEVPKDKCPAKWFAGPWSECTKKCGGGEQYRRVMCLSGGKEDLHCDKETILDITQSCNIGPCDKDDLLPIDSKTTPILDDYDETDCVEEDEEYPEVGAEAYVRTYRTLFPDFEEDPTTTTKMPEETGSGFGWIEYDETSTTDGTESTETTVSFYTDVESSTQPDVTTSIESSTAESSDSVSTENIENSTTESTSSSGTEISDLTTENDEFTTLNSVSSTSDSSVSSTTENGESSTTENAASSTTDSTVLSTSEITNSISTEVIESSTTDSASSGITEITDSSTENDELITTESGPTPSEIESSSTESIDYSTLFSSESSITDSDVSSTTEGGISSIAETKESDISSTTETELSSTSESSESTITENPLSTTESTDSSTIISTSYSTQESSEFSTTDNVKFSTTESDFSTIIESSESSTESSITITTEGDQSSTTEISLSSSTEISDYSTTESGVSSTTEIDQSSTSNGTPSASESPISSTSENVESSTTGSSEFSTTESGLSSTSESDISSTTESAISTTTENAQSSTTASDQSSTSENTLSSTTDNGASITTESFATSDSPDTSTTGDSTDSTTNESSTDYSSESSTTEFDETGTTGSTETTETEESSTASGSTDASTSSEEPLSTESSVTETTPYDWASTVEEFTNKPRCKARKIAKCTKSKFGCCPDKKTSAAGPFDEGCPNPETCKDSKYGCCPDGVSPAAGAQGRGCPVTPCNETLYGCCSNNVSAAEGNNQEGCPPLPPACSSSKYGCCDDNETDAKGPEKEGCPETEIETEKPTPAVDEGCATSEFGCCFDNETDASGPNGEGCPCSISEFGCCPDGLTAANGNRLEGCLMSCNTSAYGCCPDGETPAHGPEFEGCCLQHVFGCCPDNYGLAEGPLFEGCGCEYARFGCCTDNVTVARGPNMEGCGCEHSRYGCCPDRHTEAQGSELMGCECHTYQFGCCPDGVTIATGPELEGCRCERSKYGCCGDEITLAKGPNMEGCDCANSKYGCCPDGETEAKGEKFLNCSNVPINRQAACALDNDKGTCRNYTVHWFYDMQYGGCSQFWYGGCEGNGNRFVNKEDCEDVCVQPPPKDVCNLPKVKATCDGYHVRWYYNPEREQCSQFVYGGCLGNANNFDTKELCQERCEPEKTQDQCNLAIERGPCAGNFARWGFSVERRRCEQFVWGGCGGNLNRYDSEAACHLRCAPPGQPQQACSLPQDAGNCTEKHPVWSFNQTENRCVPFYYSGCGGNDNRFNSEHSCDDSCPSTYVKEMCTLPAMVGDCADYTQRWFFDTTKKRCRLFYYGGCGGNENNFHSESECENRCSEQPTSTTTVKPEPLQPQTERAVENERSEFCLLDIDKGPCTESLQHWAYDTTSRACVQFEYGGCGGNRNNFPTLEYCQYYCGSTTSQQDVCQLPFVSGPCDQSIMQWFYDAATDSCNLFTYGGCEGNGNRFNSRTDCERQCRIQTDPPLTTTTPVTTVAAEIVTIPTECQVTQKLEECVESGEVWFLDLEQRSCVAFRNEGAGPRCRHTGIFRSQEDCERNCGAFRGLDVCRYSLDPGPCHESIPKVYFEAATKRCETFTYGGCLGGPNRFSTIEECEQICRPNVDPCSQSPEPGNCLGYFLMWYYDSERDACNQFVYGGCNGNDNRYANQEECERRCKKAATTTYIPTTPSLTTLAPPPTPESKADAECATPVSLAPCGVNVTVYYFDTRTQACLVGDFGACSYSNRYRTEEECERRCGAFRQLDVCGSRLDPGPCLNVIPKFYWDPLSGRCLSFAYGGCDGGPNRFSTEDECEEICGATGPEARCLAPVSSGTPGCGAPSRRWYYSAVSGECIAFVFSGCGGNDNNFHTYEECALCKRVSSPISELPQEPSPNPATEPEVHANLGGTATLRCLFHGNPPPKITWQRGQIMIDADVGRYRLLSDGALEIVSLYRNDSGVYICIADNGHGVARQEVNLQVDDSRQNEILITPRQPQTEATTTIAPEIMIPMYTEMETGNEVLPDCDVYNAECAALQCQYGVQRTRSRSGCETCTCVAPEVDCAQLARDCLNLKCNYGKRKTIDDDGCERCICIDHPCANKECLTGERCVPTPYRDPITLDVLYTSDCRLANKSGSCPSNYVSVSSTESRCRRQCNDDADCLGLAKCCERGCSQLCIDPVAPTSPAPTVTSYVPELPQIPSANSATEPEVHATLGGTAVLRCLFHGNPPPKITWQRGQILIDADVGRYRLLSDGALEIVSLYRNDSGVYICIADNGHGVARQEVNLQVDDGVEGPAGIAGLSDAVVVGELGQPLSVRCMAYGFPPPSIFWYHGRNGPMVPYSSVQYEARDNVLQIKRLSIDTLGEYICQTYNGIGKPVDWSITVKAYRINDFDDSIYLVSHENEVLITPRQPQTESTTTIAPEIEIPVYVPVTTRIGYERTRLVAGSELNLQCQVDGHPAPEVYWTKDSATISSDDRITVTETRLTVSRTNTNDTGEYSCHAFNSFTSHYSSVHISVEGLYIPSTCKDNPYFANCDLIVRSKYCYHKYYSKFCCKSCVEAGQLEVHNLQLQADDTLYRK